MCLKKVPVMVSVKARNNPTHPFIFTDLLKHTSKSDRLLLMCCWSWQVTSVHYYTASSALTVEDIHSFSFKSARKPIFEAFKSARKPISKAFKSACKLTSEAFFPCHLCPNTHMPTNIQCKSHTATLQLKVHVGRCQIIVSRAMIWRRRPMAAAKLVGLNDAFRRLIFIIKNFSFSQNYLLW